MASACRTLLALAVVTAVAACGWVAPVQRGAPAAPPPRHLFIGHHGVPLAYGGGVCAVESPHTHSYPPVPAAAFLSCPEGARDQRPVYAYSGSHPHPGGTCFLSAWHLHLEPPGPGLAWDEDQAAYVAGPPGEHACDRHPCAHHPGWSRCDGEP